MIGALDHREMSRDVFSEPSSTMPADIIKSTNLGLLIPDYDQAFTRDICQKIITRSRDLTLMSNQDPVSGEDLILLLQEQLLRNEILLRQRLCATTECLSSFAKRR